MNYPIIIIIIIFGLLAGIQTTRLENSQRDLANLKTSYATAAVSAVTHAQAVEAKQDAAIKTQTDNALSQALSATSKANASKSVYDAKLAAIEKQKPLDLGHACSAVKIPSDLIP